VIVGIGMDLIDIVRVERLLADRGERALRRLFTDGEAAYCLPRGEPARHFAARLAAKEATYKALAGNKLARAVGWREIEVVSEWDGRPTLALHGRAAERAAEMGVQVAMLTLTHSDASAAAVVILQGDVPNAPPPKLDTDH
jgi:holo-[acyl-carrier protein] synthase